VTPLLAAHRRALALAGAAVAAIPPDTLDLETPCAGWTLDQLLAHMVGQNHGFAAAARGDGADLARWTDRPVGDDPAGAFARSAAEVAEAFAAADAPFDLPELRTRPVPAQRAIGFHLLDTLVHGWDVAVAVGIPYGCPPEDAQLLLGIARRVPGVRPPGSPFRPGLTPVGGVSRPPFDQALALLGRDPDWRPRWNR